MESPLSHIYSEGYYGQNGYAIVISQVRDATTYIFSKPLNVRWTPILLLFALVAFLFQASFNRGA
jgi:hypothetical protein